MANCRIRKLDIYQNHRLITCQKFVLPDTIRNENRSCSLDHTSEFANSNNKFYLQIVSMLVVDSISLLHIYVHNHFTSLSPKQECSRFNNYRWSCQHNSCQPRQTICFHTNNSKLYNLLLIVKISPTRVINAKRTHPRKLTDDIEL